jgi:hypothetical protein
MSSAAASLVGMNEGAHRNIAYVVAYGIKCEHMVTSSIVVLVFYIFFSVTTA